MESKNLKACFLFFRVYNFDFFFRQKSYLASFLNLPSTKVSFLCGCFSRFLNCTNDTKWCKASLMTSVSGATFIPNSNITQKRNFLESCWDRFFRHRNYNLSCSQHRKMLVDMILNILRYLLFLIC